MAYKYYKQMEMQSYFELVDIKRKIDKRFKAQATNGNIPLGERLLIIELHKSLSNVLSGVYDKR